MIEKGPDDSIHLAGDTVETLLLALCCLEAMWTAYPDIVRAICKEQGHPDLVKHGPNARMLITAIMALK